MGENSEDFRKETEEYVSLLSQLGMKDRDESANKNRAHRRFNFDSPEKTILLHIGDNTCALYDVSIGGLSFNSKVEYEIGEQLGLDFDGRFDVEVTIANHIPQTDPADGGDSFSQHGAKFVRTGDGYRCTRAVLEYFLEIEKMKF